jgi:hypothetical protein
MNIKQYRITGGLLTVILFGANAAQAGDCWLDVYDKPALAGAHVRVEGPIELPNLKTLQGGNWSNRIESLRVGPTAEVVAFTKENFSETHTGPLAHPDALKSASESEIAAAHDLEISFGPGKQEHHLGEVKFHKNINSLKIRCQ